MAIEDHALIGDTQTAALVTRDASIDWLCLPRFDSPACFAALLGDESHGHWSIRPATGARPAGRRYRDDTLVLETELEADSGVVRIVDCMPIRDRHPTVVRLVECTRGSVHMEMELVIRFDYGRTVPWVRGRNGSLEAIAGSNALFLHSPVETYGRDLTTRAEFTVRAGETVPFWCGARRTRRLPIPSSRGARSTRPSAGGGSGRGGAMSTSTATW